MKNEWMSRLRLMLVLLLMVLVSVPAAARKKPRPRKVQPVVTVSLNENDAKRFNYFFLEAVRQQHLGNYAGAFDLFRHCLEINPSSPETYFSLSAYYSEMRNDSAMLAVMKKAAELSPDNETYLERLGQAYLRIQDYAKATEVYEQLAANSPRRSDVLSMLVQLYQQEQKLRQDDRGAQPHGDH